MSMIYLKDILHFPMKFNVLDFLAHIAKGRAFDITWCPSYVVNIHSQIRVITKLPNSEQSYKGKVKTHNYINRQNQSTTGKL